MRPLGILGKAKKSEDGDVDMHESRQPSGVKQPPIVGKPNIQLTNNAPPDSPSHSVSASGRNRNRVTHKF